MLYENNTFYWYGENKERTDGENKIWTWGVKCYSSKDLYNWKDEGFIIEADPENPESMFHPERRLDRPHIIYNEQTGKYVCWIKYSGDDACFAILTADHILGPYEVKEERFRPHGKKAGDFDVAVDEETKKAHLYFDSDHTGLTCVELSEDYLNVTEEESMHFDDRHPPFVREAPAHFVRNGRHYLLTSGLTGYLPNPSEAAVAENFHGPYTIQGNPHVADESYASFNSQISCIFKHPGKKDLYIAMADRWVPEYVVTKERYQAIERAIGARFDQRYQPTEEDIKLINESPILASANTSKSTYVWLPIRFDGERALIDWKEEWSVEDYE
ncbi:MAG: family 43 glycosylhydrolase [Suipraeoptans sp.]